MKNKELNPALRETGLYKTGEESTRPLTRDEQRTTMRKHDKMQAGLGKGSKLNIKTTSNKIDTLKFPNKELKGKQSAAMP